MSLLKRQWLLYDLFEELPTTCWPFVIPKTSEKVSLITSYANQNGLEGCTPPPRFLLRSWEHLRELLVTLHAGVPLYAMHIDLMNAFWSSGLVESARTFFRLCSGPNRRVVGLGRLPFGCNYSTFICQQVRARIVEHTLPPYILFIHNLDDCLFMHHDKGYVWGNTGGTLDALERGVFIVSPQSVLELATKLVLLWEWLALLERMVWSHEVARLQMLLAWLRLAIWRSQKRLMRSFWGFLH